MKSITAWLAAIAMASRVLSCSTTTPCPDSYGSCNKCVEHSGRVVALTRNVCGEYTREKCLRIYGEGSGLCDDGCNTCICAARGIASTRKGCLGGYDFQRCVKGHGSGLWDCV
ncbi:hypothetical protein CP532_2398 [Ophiocordyceps camponoti-leonardi (nom. inval.)]|nr:hypothetical protein CP532_2398 [Ophiocordyceps camponoti-leonardi (nom. inval.)]